ncbi:E3 ubiquitin-protein ligase RNF181-like isoform X2 [Homarus americanus]|uniref:RING-type E3 ubiquitin transferase n=2 Tax=Homarus americanus TaxID=6706 RepID=A0A8J5K480_HOMAM|nr:E3 ubiquitin-protein ligase RNF181-like isoform X2 [Homarus americanus]XP_042225283.1 E3 ubiquitin-protein ligase RNF181-like isoform X2 [Homarus americanus]XP_042225284.1 E3 ubiquitin-protein ligase RNF181-like isoform X2 [Homarus americanus]XP_042225285.1 E3 ubiquitin-protein ligase RNF181-like isoform X2 [Homarus americanus]KAG7167238.1 E3 ubiquitin-protein ligase RNF181-like [Homarus americanus]
MSSYFDEHDCQPLRAGQLPDHFLHMARLLLHGGYWQDMQVEFTQLFGFGERPPPPTSKEFIDQLTTSTVSQRGGQCPVCLKEWTEGEEMKELPCKHKFHPACILPWLEKTNSCPMCRYELPTDDEDYEEYRRQKKRAKDREAEIEMLHHSMFS